MSTEFSGFFFTTSIFSFRGMAYAVYYKTEGTGREPKCPDYEYLFNKAIQSRITVKASNGRILTVSHAIESALLAKVSAFNFNIKSDEPVTKDHLKNIETQLSEKWTAQLSGMCIGCFNELQKWLYTWGIHNLYNRKKN